MESDPDTAPSRPGREGPPLSGFRSVLLVAATVGVIALLGRWMSNGEQEPRGGGASPARVVTADPQPPFPEMTAVAGPPAVRSEPPGPEAAVPAAEPAPVTARTFLAEYYGDRWPEIEARIEASGQADLDSAYRFRPWEEVQGEFERSIPMGDEGRKGIVESMVKWPAELTTAFVRSEFALDPRRELDESDLAAIGVLVEGTNQELNQVAEVFVDRIDLYVHEKWNTGDYLRAPFTTAGLSEEMGFHSQSHGGYGWAATFTLTREAYPDMAELEQDVRDLREEREQIVLSYLREHTGR